MDNVIDPSKLKLVFFAVGVKSLPNNTLPRAECYIDCRGIPNPFQEISLAGLSGDDPKVQKWVEEKVGGGMMFYRGMVEQGLSKLLTRRKGEDPYEKPFRVCTMCAHGVHRSRAMKHLLAAQFKKQGYQVEEQ